MKYFIYILSNFKRNVVYTGVTNNLVRRIWEHRQGLVKGFTERYQIHDLIYYEEFTIPEDAIEREKQIKSWSRKRKDELISKFNPTLQDLYDSII